MTGGDLLRHGAITIRAKCNVIAGDRLFTAYNAKYVLRLMLLLLSFAKTFKNGSWKTRLFAKMILRRGRFIYSHIGGYKLPSITCTRVYYISNCELSTFRTVAELPTWPEAASISCAQMLQENVYYHMNRRIFAKWFFIPHRKKNSKIHFQKIETSNQKNVHQKPIMKPNLSPSDKIQISSTKN